MPSPKVMARNWWYKLKDALPVLLPSATVLGAILYAAGLFAIDTRVDLKVTAHELDPYPHAGEVELELKYTALSTKMISVEKRMGEIVASHEATDQKIGEAVELLEKLINKK